MLLRTSYEGHSLGLGRASLWYRVAYGTLALTILLRLSWYPVVVSDYTYFVKPWFDTLQTHTGLTAFAYPFADYAPAYLYLLKLLTFIPVHSLYSGKTLSFVFDILIAYFGYAILKKTSPWSTRKDILFFAAAAFLALPTVMINSSLWGQSDAIYGVGVIGSLFFILIDAPLFAAIVFALALCVKVQAIFFAPILIGYILRKRERWKYLAVPPALFLLSILPAWAGGGSFLYWLCIYATQAGEYPYLSVSAQSIFAFLQPLALSASATNTFFWLGVTGAAAIAALFIYMVKKTSQLSPVFLVTISLAATLLIPYLLPRMHERYFYLADLISLLYAFYLPRRFLVPILVVFTSLISYMPFLSPQVSFLSWAHVDLRVPATLLLIPIGIVLYDLRRLWRSQFEPSSVS